MDRGSGDAGHDEEFHEFVAQRRGRLLHTARLLTAGDQHLAEDLVQSTLTKLYVVWCKRHRIAELDAYVRRTMVNALVNERRRGWWRFERPSAHLPDRVAAPPAADELDPELARALSELPPRMRAAVVFRFFHELDVAETARALSCSSGTVKSQTARALDKLRAALEEPRAALLHASRR